jgi:hypothetical protein
LNLINKIKTVKLFIENTSNKEMKVSFTKKIIPLKRAYPDMKINKIKDIESK